MNNPIIAPLKDILMRRHELRINHMSFPLRPWMQTCGVTCEEVSAETELFHFEGDVLIIFGYPHNVQASIEAKESTESLGTS